MTNRLADEVSPYLRQHAENPVDWYPYGEEAIALARQRDCPILLSIGYSACHWCHVMERESFDDPATAARMNADFVCIKVDREERPDLDQIYQTVVQLMRRSGGWPLTVFLTPSLRPFFAGTYFPPVARYGMPDFVGVLDAVASAYRERRDEVDASAEQLTRAIEEVTRRTADPSDPPLDATRIAGERLLALLDPEHGGFGTRPKFPNTMALELLLRAAHRGLDGALDAVLHALFAMARGGMRDQLGGGFHRYSTDERWLVPHFEKMLYDNALLAKLYANAFRLTGDPSLGEVARETLQYVLREMTDARGRFYSSEDADSADDSGEAREGAFFVFTPPDVDAALEAAGAPELGALAKLAFGVGEPGNFEGGPASVLHRPRTDAELAAALAMDEADIAAAVERARHALLAHRAARPRPARDEKILATWNGLMIEAFAEVGGALGEPVFVEAAARALDAVCASHLEAETLYRVTLGDAPARVPAFLEDHADLANAALAVYRAILDARALEIAVTLVDGALAAFEDPEHGGFYFTRQDSPHLIVRTKDAYDNAVPGGQSALVHALLALSAITGEPRYAEAATRAIRASAEPALRLPLGFGHFLCAMDRARFGMIELVVVAASDEDARPLLDAARAAYAPDLVLRRVAPDEAAGPSPASALVPRTMRDGRPTAYVCQHGTCSAPCTTPDELRARLDVPR